MGLNKKLLVLSTILTIIFCLYIEQVDGRRVILKGRKAVTRTYYYDSILPAWLSVLLIALGEIIFGGVLYIILKKVVIDPPMSGFYNVERDENTSLRP